MIVVPFLADGFLISIINDADNGPNEVNYLGCGLGGLAIASVRFLSMLDDTLRE